MANRKQRRRRQKEHRHEYEIVYVDDEGNELEVEPEEQEKAPRRTRGERGRPERKAQDGRPTVQPPSWARTAKRGLIFAPIMLVTVFLISPEDATLAGQVVQTVLLLALFLPFSYFLDSLLWRSHQKRLAKVDGARPARKR
jgi:hypothetical protein